MFSVHINRFQTISLPQPQNAGQAISFLEPSLILFSGKLECLTEQAQKVEPAVNLSSKPVEIPPFSKRSCWRRLIVFKDVQIHPKTEEIQAVRTKSRRKKQVRLLFMDRWRGWTAAERGDRIMSQQVSRYSWQEQRNVPNCWRCREIREGLYS